MQLFLGTGKYLGLPSIIGLSKKATFGYIKNYVWNKVNFCSGNFLSKGGHEVLVKVVLQAIPSFCMSIFLIPPSLCDEIQKMINSFWWGKTIAEQKVFIGFHGINYL